MGIYFNPNNESFTQAGNSMVYVDKTGLMELLNRRLSTEKVLNSYELRIIKRLQFAAFLSGNYPKYLSRRPLRALPCLASSLAIS